MIKQIIFFCLYIGIFQSVTAFKLDRVILATDTHPNYIAFWPVAARMWREIVGVQPTLALIAEDNVQVDETLGDVIRFKPIPGVPTSLYAQCIRLFLPCLFPDDVCIVSDIDLLPLQKKFFTKHIRKIPDDCLVVYRDRHYSWYKSRIYINYIAAKGAVFREIFGIQATSDIPGAMHAWERLRIGWSTDEKLLYKYVSIWKKKNKHRVKKLGFGRDKSKRICRREHCKYSKRKLKKRKYIELNCPRPYEQYKDLIDRISQLALLASKKRNGKA